MILTNSPFGGVEEDGIQDNFPAEFRTRETADLFLVLFISLLKPDGRAGVVLPDGTLLGEGVKTRLKQQLLAECNLHTIVRLPNSVFKPYASIGTNLLFFEKGRPTEEIWYYEQPVPEGQKAYSMTRPIKAGAFCGLRGLVGRPQPRGPAGNRASLACADRPDPGAQLQPRPQESPRGRRRPRRPRGAAGRGAAAMKPARSSGATVHP